MNIPEFIFNTEKINIFNPKLTENNFNNKIFRSPVVADDLNKKASKESILKKNTYSVLVNQQNNNEVHNDNNVNEINSKVVAGKINELYIAHVLNDNNLGLDNRNLKKGIYKLNFFLYVIISLFFTFISNLPKIQFF